EKLLMAVASIRARPKAKGGLSTGPNNTLRPAAPGPISKGALTGCRSRSFVDRLRGRETSQPAEPDPVCTGGGIRRFGSPAHQFPATRMMEAPMRMFFC